MTRRSPLSMCPVGPVFRQQHGERDTSRAMSAGVSARRREFPGVQGLCVIGVVLLASSARGKCRAYVRYSSSPSSPPPRPSCCCWRIYFACFALLFPLSRVFRPSTLCCYRFVDIPVGNLEWKVCQRTNETYVAPRSLTSMFERRTPQVSAVDRS